jgi:predicted RNA binding protein YcfA (HicA-like mRNA interferase family)
LKVPSLSYHRIVRAFQRDGWVKHLPDETLKVTIPAHRPVKRSTLSHILKAARLTVDRFLELV